MRGWCQWTIWACSYSSSSSWCWTACSTPLVFILARWLSLSPGQRPALPCPALPLCPAPLPCAVMSAPALLCLFCPALLPCPALPCPAPPRPAPPRPTLPCPALPCLSICPAPPCHSMPEPASLHVNPSNITAYVFRPALSPLTQLPSTHTLTGWLWSEGLHALQALLLWAQMALFYYYTFSLFWSPFSSSTARNQLRLLMLMKTASFALSALQLRSGYPPRASFRYLLPLRAPGCHLRRLPL